MDISRRVSDKSASDAQVDRDRLNGNPDVIEGMEEEGDIFGWDTPSSFGGLGQGGGLDTSFGDESSFGGFGGFDSGYGSGFNGQQNPFGMPENNSGNKDKKELEDQLTEGALKASKGFLALAKEILEDAKNFNAIKGADLFRYASIQGVVFLSVSLVLSFFSKGLLDVAAYGAAMTAVSIVPFVYCYTLINKEGYEPKHTESPVGEGLPENPFGNEYTSASPDLMSFGIGDQSMVDFEEGSNKNPFEDEEEEVGGAGIFDEDEDEELFQELAANSDTYTEENKQDTSNLETDKFDQLLNRIENKQLMTRQVIFDTMVSVLPSYASDFSTPVEVDEGTTEFNQWDSVIKDCAKSSRPSNGVDKDMPHLIRLEKKLFYYLLVVSRTPWVKNIDKYVAEIVNFVSIDEDTGKRDQAVIGTGEISGDRMYIRIMQPSQKAISLKDAMLSERDFFLDTSNQMPVILGVTEEGKAYTEDLKSVESMLIAGMPRSGKTIQAESILTTLMMFLPPSELHLHILDPKDGISSFKYFDAPHVKRFETQDSMIVKALDDIVNKEGERRKQLFSDNNVIKIQEYNKLKPNEKEPFIYIIIDEVLTLAERMVDDVKDQFQKNLTIIISQLPALGIRLIMIPHVIKDKVISKTTTDLITCRMSVRGTPDHIEVVTGIKPSQFKRKLTNVGDIAVNLGRGEATYVKGVLSSLDDDERVSIISFIRDFWLKLEPESFGDSYYYTRIRKGDTPPPENIDYLIGESSTRGNHRAALHSLSVEGSKQNQNTLSVLPSSTYKAKESPKVTVELKANEKIVGSTKESLLDEQQIKGILGEDDISNMFLK